LADAGRDTEGEHAMITMSQETGGKYYYANEGKLGEAFRKISEDLRTQYLLGYYPDVKTPDWESSGSDFRKISVTLAHPDRGNGPYSVQNRSGYYPDAAP
jgi:Ca-activated chloride channel homolog